MIYFKGQCDPTSPCYYRIRPDGQYDYFGADQRWHIGHSREWKVRCAQWHLKPIKVNRLEVLLVLGPESLKE